jgi:hypothetical protein
MARHVAHALRDLDDRALFAHAGKERPRVVRLAGIERVEHEA